MDHIGPAAGSPWPMRDLAAVMCTGRSAPGSTAMAAPISMGSPRGVPVPCISNPVTLAGVRSAALRADRITACWLGPLGAVRLLERPSCVHQAKRDHQGQSLTIQNLTKWQMRLIFIHYDVSDNP